MTAFYGYWLSTTLLALRYLASATRYLGLVFLIVSFTKQPAARDNPSPHSPVATVPHAVFQHAG